MKNQKSSSKFRLVAVISILALVVAGVVFYVHHHQASKQLTKSPSSQKQVTYSGPTKEEQQAGDQQKAIDESKTTTQPTSAQIVISNASQAGNVIRVRAFVSNVVESGGTCTTTLSYNGQTVTKQTSGTADASTTQCGVINFDRSQFSSAGTWQIKVDYSSSTLTGTASDTVIIE